MIITNFITNFFTLHLRNQSKGILEEKSVNSDCFETWYTNVSRPPESIGFIFISGTSLLSDFLGLEVTYGYYVFYGDIRTANLKSFIYASALFSNYIFQQKIESR